ncbi:hypothetical protein ABZ949_02360 [Micromonospora tulbaghiae]|uniref:hypothetical protein n=1 Tax=Micromonospora tulbaghiae TaxID=479978 RepID=UPI0033DB53CA
MAGKRYQVVAECAHVVTSTTGVRSQVLLYKGAFLPADVEPERLRFLLDGGFVAEEGEVAVAPNASVEQDPRRGADSVTEDVLRGEKPADADGPSSDVSERVAEVVSDEGRIDKAADPDGVQAAQDKTAAEVAARRAAAQEKLAALDGAAPDGRASKDVLVEYLVGQGSNYDDVSKADKSDLLAMVKSRQS